MQPTQPPLLQTSPSLFASKPTKTATIAAAAAAAASTVAAAAAAKPVARRSSLVGLNETRIAGLYDLEHTIGKGHYAVVKLARHVFTGEKVRLNKYSFLLSCICCLLQVAVKVIDKTKLDPESAADLMQEVRCMKLVQHPHIVRLYEVIDTQTKLFLILEVSNLFKAV